MAPNRATDAISTCAVIAFALLACVLLIVLEVLE